MTQFSRKPLSSELILRLQATVGNRAVQRLLEAEQLPPRPATEQETPTRWRLNSATVGTVCAFLVILAGVLLWQYNLTHPR